MRRTVWVAVVVGFVATVAALGAVSAATGGADPTNPIREDQTEGFGNERRVAFTYDMNYQCVHDPAGDLDNDGRRAAVDPDEFRKPICAVGRESTLDPAGEPAADTEPVYVLVPFFDADEDNEAASPELGAALTSLFGFRPDAFDPTPGVPVQCPEPGPNGTAPGSTAHTGAFGTCTMHPIELDLGPVLGALGLVPPNTTVKTPTPNHIHVVDGANFGSIWWKIVVVLVTDESEWPNAAATTGITSVADIRTAQAAGKALGDVQTNFFLHFDSREFPNSGRTH